jgi:serine/threonine-protein kinase RsbW
MAKRLSRVIRDHRGIILYRLIKEVRALDSDVTSAFSFDSVFDHCNRLLDGYINFICSGDPRRLQMYFHSSSSEWAQSGYSMDAVQRAFFSIGNACMPLIEKRYYRNPQACAKIKLDLETTLRTTVTLLSSIFHSVLVNSAKDESRQFERVFKEIADCIFTIDREKNVTLMNPAMEKLLGVCFSDVAGTKCYEILKWIDKAMAEKCRTNCHIMEAFNEGRRIIYYEGILQGEQKRRMWTGTTASCVCNDQGGLEEIILNMRDITPSKERQKALEDEIKTFETVAGSTHGIELKIPCMSEYVMTARAQAELIAKRMNFKADRVQDIKSAVGEACDNAIEHGCSERGVDIRYRIKGPNLIIEVEDYGSGFDSEVISGDLPSPFTEGGRGLYLIKNLVDDAEIISRKGKGTKVLMYVYRKPELFKRLRRERSAEIENEKRICVM